MSVAKKKIPSRADAGRAPKQDRSRASFERVIDAAMHMLRESGHADFTLSEVSRRSKVSIGSIYCRVDGKDELVRVLQQRAYEQMDREYAEIINRIRRRNLPLERRVPLLVREKAELLRSYATIFNAMIELAPGDPQIAATGKLFYSNHQLDWRLLILECRSQITHPDPEHAANFSFALVFSMVARHLGLGLRGGVSDGDWRELVDDLCVTCLALFRAAPADVKAARS